MHKLFDKNTIFGFKAFEKSNQGLKCRDYIYTPGKIHEMDGKPEVCSHGFHFCEELQDVDNFYDISRDYIVVYPVAAIGDISNGGEKKATNKLVVFNDPIPIDVKKSRHNFNRKDIIELSDGTEISADLDNEVDKYLFDSLKETEVIKSGRIEMKLSDFIESKKIIDSLDYSNMVKMRVYSDVTGKLWTSLEMVMDFVNNKLIKEVTRKGMLEDFEEYAPGAANLILNCERLRNHLGYKQSIRNGSYYVPELDERNQ